MVLDDSTDPKGQLRDMRTLNDKHKTLLGKYALCRVDVSSSYGEQIAEAFHAKKFPCTIVTDGSAKQIVYRRVGNFAANDWVHTLSQIQEARPQRKVGRVGAQEKATTNTRSVVSDVSRAYASAPPVQIERVGPLTRYFPFGLSLEPIHARSATIITRCAPPRV